MAKKLSIITINLNDAEGLEKTLKSVIDQTVFDQIEYIVIDGGSTDSSVDVLKKNSDSLAYWYSGKDKGIYNGMNKGVSVSTGEYLLFLNGGDNLHSPTAIQAVLPELHDMDFVIGKMVFLDTGHLFEIQDDLSLLHFMKGSLPHNATFIKRNWLEKYPYDESYRIVSDWKFFLQSFVLGGASYRCIDTVVSDFDCNGISSKNRDLCEFEKQQILKELFPQRVLDDYRHFLKGGGYKDTDYDRFYIQLRERRYGTLLYRCNLAFMKFVSLFRKSARFARQYR